LTAVLLFLHAPLRADTVSVFPTPTCAADVLLTLFALSSSPSTPFADVLCPTWDKLGIPRPKIEAIRRAFVSEYPMDGVQVEETLALRSEVLILFERLLNTPKV
jgi:hypothetical protein